MLVEFQVQNFRSFRERQTFSMVASPFPEHRETNTFDPNLKGFGGFLRSAVVYGPNAAGKTNLLRAVQFAQALILNSAATTAEYPYTPFKFAASTRGAPSEFEFTIVQNGVRYEYGFTMGPERFEKEWLIEYANPRGRAMFKRTYDARKKDYNWKFSPFLKGQRATWSESTRPNALFLSTAVQLNSTQLLPVFEWFQKRLIVIAGPTKMNQGLTYRMLEEPGGKERLLPFLREADLGIADLEVLRQEVPSGGIIISAQNAILEKRPGRTTADALTVTLSHVTDNPNEPMALDFAEESQGTQVLFGTAGAWLNVMANGEVLLFDEIDASLHPLLVRYLIERFHSTSANPHNAQLICSTHNTSLQDRELFRRDQVWFVEKTNEGSSKLYPLTDFSPRNDESLERGYMRGRYGALPLLPTISD
jgi:AAA15 family ATPase/GTPase